jgi:hypothetical protein
LDNDSISSLLEAKDKKEFLDKIISLTKSFFDKHLLD